MKKENMIYRNEIIDKLYNADKVVIYGAGVMGKALKRCLTEEPYCLKIEGFLVENMTDNPNFIDDIPVFALTCAELLKNALVLVALHEKHMSGVVKKLTEMGYLNVETISFDSDVWSDIRGNWFWKNGLSENVQFVNLEESFTKYLSLYEVHSVADRKLKEEIACRSFEIPIQVGAALTDIRLFPTTDNEVDVSRMTDSKAGVYHISEKNRQYCELTALYWIWKYDNSEYAGLQHYRRKFEIEKRIDKKITNLELDVIVTVPVLNFPSVRQQYCMDHEEKDWDMMLEAIAKLYPECMEAADEVQNGNYYYAYNMFIMRKEILDRYCEWLFPILFYCEERIGEKEDKYQNRYIGFLAERLLTIYLRYHKEYKIGIVRKHFIESR